MLAKAIQDTRGASTLEFGITAPLYFMLLAGIVEFGLLFWSQVGLQHGAEMAARCASINSSICPSSSATQAYAAQQSYGLNPPVSTFTADSAACGSQVTASYPFQFFVSYFGVPSITLNAKACFPK